MNIGNLKSNRNINIKIKEFIILYNLSIYII
jgi:hypothetical protein